MRRVALASVTAFLAVGAAQSASAADIPARMIAKAPTVVAAHNWTGCYVGAHVGYGSARKEWSDNVFLLPEENPFTTHNADGVLAGGQLGCDLQRNRWVFGAEAQFSWANLKGSSGDPFIPEEIDRTKIDWFGTVTGRVGYTWNRVLLYVKGGGAWVNEHFQIGDTDFGGAVHFDAGHKTRWGWTVGAGLEYAFAPKWSVKVEYNYLDFGSAQHTFNDVLHAGVDPFVYDIDQRIHTAKVGVNWRWYQPAAMVSR